MRLQGLLVVVSADTPLPFLANLRRVDSILLAGDRQVDLTALAKFRTLLGTQCPVSEAGGGLNGALPQADLANELHIITVPH